MKDLLVIAGKYLDLNLRDNWPCIDTAIYEVDGATGGRHPSREGITYRVCAREGRKQGGVGVDHLPFEPFNAGGTQNSQNPALTIQSGS